MLNFIEPSRKTYNLRNKFRIILVRCTMLTTKIDILPQEFIKEFQLLFEYLCHFEFSRFILKIITKPH